EFRRVLFRSVRRRGRFPRDPHPPPRHRSQRRARRRRGHPRLLRGHLPRRRTPRVAAEARPRRHLAFFAHVRFFPLFRFFPFFPFFPSLPSLQIGRAHV